MPSIGSVSCDIIKGEIPEPGETVETFRTPGQDGHGSQLMGKGDGGFSIVAQLYGTAAQLETFYQALVAVRGTTVTITGDWAVARTNCDITGVSLPVKRAARPITMCLCSVRVWGVKHPS